MNLYILRHGMATEVGGKIKRDFDRPLSEEGIESLKISARAMKRLDVKPDLILSSPLVRAKQTAEVVATILDAEDRIEICESLGIPCDHTALADRLGNISDRQTLMLVGHDPDMSRLPGWFVGVPELVLPFKKGSLCCLETTLHRRKFTGSIRWFLHPKQLKLMA